MENKSHVWQFARIGGVTRVVLKDGNDLKHLASLDQKQWTVLSCPVEGLEIEKETLKLIDTDNDGKIRVPEVLHAVQWILQIIKDANKLLLRSHTLPLNLINQDCEEGLQLYNAAKQILKNLGKADANEISTLDTCDIEKIFANTAFNGDGIITTFSTDEPLLKEWITTIINTCGSVKDRSGEEGINKEKLTEFQQNCIDFIQWKSLAKEKQSQIFLLGDSTSNAYENYKLIEAKILDYFLRCQLAAIDASNANKLNSWETYFENFQTKDLTIHLSELATLPIAKINVSGELDFDAAINPAWKVAFDTLKKYFQQIFTSKKSLTQADWELYADKLKPFETWMAEKKGTLVEQLGEEKINDFIKNNIFEKIQLLIEKDLALENESNQIIQVDKLTRYYRDLFRLLNNFVTFTDFYAPHADAIFQAGTLYFDQRSCDLCIIVNDLPKHFRIANQSGIFLAYLDCVSKAKDKKMTIVAAFTDGDVENIEVGRNAVFYDKKGLDWDATIVKIIEHPISIKQAFWSPYKRISNLVSKQIQKIAASQDEKIAASSSKGVQNIGNKAEDAINKPIKDTPTDEKEKPKSTPFDIAKFAGIFAAIGLAVGALGSMIVSVISGFAAMIWWKIPIAILGLILSISLPSMFLAWLKLRKRNLAMVLDANGWAINSKLLINIPFGATLTHLSKLPANAKINFNDPFKKKSNFKYYLLAIIAIAAIALFLWYLGYWNPKDFINSISNFFKD